MPTRTIKLKMALPRCEQGRPVRCDLWTTHAAVNQAVKHIEQILLLCRGDDYEDSENGLHCRDEVRARALEYARTVQRENGHPNEGSDESVLLLLRRLYENIIQSAVEGKSGKAQEAREFVSPLMDAASQGGRHAAKKVLQDMPAWVDMMQKGAPDWQALSVEWLRSPEATNMIKIPGRKSHWVDLQRKGEPWQEAFVANQKRLNAKVASSPLESLRNSGLLPLLKPPIRSKLADPRGGVSRWDRLAVGLTVGHLNSWESNNRRARVEYGALHDKVEQLRRNVDQEALQRVRDYEESRHEELKRIALANDDAPYRLGRRALRGWELVRERWRSGGCQGYADRIKVLAEIQTRLRGRFGDPHFYRWLAEPPQETLWKQSDPLPHIVLLNDALYRLGRKKNGAALTAADPRIHPRWVQFERPGGSNLQNYYLEQEEEELTLRLSLLHDEGDGFLHEVEHRIRLARSKQFAEVKVQQPNGRSGAPAVTYVSARQTNQAQIGSADILFKRPRLENCPTGRLCEGEIGPVWLKLALDIVPQVPESWQGADAQRQVKSAVSYFRRAPNVRRSAEPLLQPGLRVLSIDLGVRVFAACSVFTLTDSEPDAGMYFRVQGADGLWACHERSFVLSLPGECPDHETQACRDAVIQEMLDLRSCLSRLNGLLRLSVQTDPEVRRLVLSGWLEAATDGNENLKRLLDAAEAEPAAWEKTVLACRAELEIQAGARLSAWRRSTRPRAVTGDDHRQRRGYHGGKSMWAIQYLTDVRRLLLGWSLHGKRSGHIRRQDRRGGIFASRLLRHINALKDDRVKTGADLIVQASRGLIPGANGSWLQKYAPCQLILFENLARYRFRTDRSRRENSQLMRWCHRTIYRETEMQAEAYGIQVQDTGAGFSSRYHARTGAPGLRVWRVTQQDLADPATKTRLSDAMQSILGSPVEPCLGDLVPWPGGPEFVSLSAGGHSLVSLHADINAAQNLQRRLWTRHTDAYRMTATRFDLAGQEVWLPNPLGKRLQGALVELGVGTGYARLTTAPNGDGYVLSPIRKAEWTRAIGAEAEPEAEMDAQSDEDADMEVLDELATAVRTRTSETFFRDPSGIVLPSDRWYPGKVYWARVQAHIGPLLRASPCDPF